MPNRFSDQDQDQSQGQDARKRSLLEQHAQSVLLAVITGTVLYSGSFVIQAREESSKMTVQMSTLTTEVAAMRAQIGVMQQSYVSREDFRDHESRLRVIEAWPRTVNRRGQ